MAMLRKLAGLVCVLGFLAPGPGAAQALLAVPPVRAHVTDNAGMLDAKQRAALDGVLADYEAKTGSQIAVLLVASTAPEAIEQYGIRVADAWKLGRKGVDDGVLLLVAKDNPPALRRLRIEAGRGVQGVLTDAQSKRVLQDVIAPHFRQNDYYGGLVAGVGAIATLLNQEQFPAAAQGKPANSVEEDGDATFWGPLLLLGALALAALRRSRGGPRRGGWARNASGVLLGAALGSRGGGISGGGGGFSGSGGFSGGGGSFDGGGASGDW
ncbi:uncharacterized protein ACFDR9_001895 [Janthinobacterium sp. CG_23.3]|uniref:TPM domain-containing protein n=1 Tax=unclassified Janthinobacterium TaxID=2610881 RepID=UPI002E08C84E|nr:uncharacterized protein [Janthinobacterium sp. CG_S6]